MKAFLYITWLFLLIGCSTQPQQTHISEDETDAIESISPESIPPKTEKTKRPAAIRYFQKEGIWDTLLSLCPAQDTTTFQVYDFYNRNLTNIDSTSAGAYIRGIHGLKSVYPLRLTILNPQWKLMTFYGEQYDSDQITTFLGVVTLSSDLSEKGEIESLSTQGDFAEESWAYFAEFQSDTAFTIMRIDKGPCEDFEGNKLTGEISELHYKKFFSISSLGNISELRTDTLKIKFCD